MEKFNSSGRSRESGRGRDSGRSRESGRGRDSGRESYGRRDSGSSYGGRDSGRGRDSGSSYGRRDSGRGRDSGYGRRDSGRGRDSGYGRRDSWDNGSKNRRDAEMHEVICSECKEKCMVPFKPQTNKPLFCDKCFSKQNPKNSDLSKELSEINNKLDKIMNALNV